MSEYYIRYYMEYGSTFEDVMLEHDNEDKDKLISTSEADSNFHHHTSDELILILNSATEAPRQQLAAAQARIIKLELSAERYHEDDVQNLKRIDELEIELKKCKPYVSSVLNVQFHNDALQEHIQDLQDEIKQLRAALKNIAMNTEEYAGRPPANQLARELWVIYNLTRDALHTPAREPELIIDDKQALHGKISHVRQLTTRNGDIMAIMMLDHVDEEIVLFPRTYDKYKDRLVKGTTVSLDCTADLVKGVLQYILDEIKDEDTIHRCPNCQEIFGEPEDGLLECSKCGNQYEAQSITGGA